MSISVTNNNAQVAHHQAKEAPMGKEHPESDKIRVISCDYEKKWAKGHPWVQIFMFQGQFVSEFGNNIVIQSGYRQ